MTGRNLPKQAILVVNTQSRRGAEAYKDARRKLIAAGIELTGSHAVRKPERLVPTVRKAIRTGVPMVIVGGGDGTLSSAIDDFMGSKTVFAVLPLGTANSFARALGVPLDLDGAIQVIARGVRRRIDLGSVDGDYFAGSAAMGMSPLIAETVPPRLKKLLGRVGYLIWAGRVAARFRPFKLRIDDGKTVHKVWATEARIANGGFGGGVELVEKARLDSGEIVVQAVTGKSIAGLAWNWVATAFKLPHRENTVAEFHGRELKLSARPAQKISIDGELAAKTPVTVSVAKGAVWVAAPRAAGLSRPG